MMMDDIEITVHHPYASHASINNIKIDEYGAAAIFRLLLKLGATKDVRLYYGDGGIRVHRKFRYQSAVIPSECDNGERTGDWCQSLEDYLISLIRLNKKEASRQNRVNGAINRIAEAVRELQR